MADDSGEFSDSSFGLDGKKSSDDEFDYGNNADHSRLGSKAPSTVVQNQPYDEAVDLGSSGSLDESVDTNEASSPPPRSPAGGISRGDSPPVADDVGGRADYGDDDDVEIPGHPTRAASNQRLAPAAAPAPDNESESSTSDDEEDGPGGAADQAGNRGGYNPADYAHLDVSTEIRELFGYIGRYKPHNIELDTKIKCFIPDYIPAVGEIDAFIKVSRPDSKADDLGLKVLDEPSAHQSDPTVLDLIWRSLIKKSNLDPVRVRSIEHADKNPKEITKWINSVNDLHRTKPPPQVQYTKSMPDIEMLMQEWPPEFEKRLKQVKLPTSDINLSLKEYAAVICALMDIPVYNSTIQSLHVLFTLYSEFKTNQHFMNMQAANSLPTGAGGAGAGAGAGSGGANTMTFSS